jgi:hypothetical protein
MLAASAAGSLATRYGIVMHIPCVNGILLSDESARSLSLRKAARLPKHSGLYVSPPKVGGASCRELARITSR